MGEIQKIGSKGENFQLQEELSSEDLKYGTDNGIIYFKVVKRVSLNVLIMYTQKAVM